MGEVSCYTMDLYCDHPGHGIEHAGTTFKPGQLTGRSYAEVVRIAKESGWLILKSKSKVDAAISKYGIGDVSISLLGSGIVICPNCHERPSP